jgi:peptide-methionine (R)-S-oxide reductase
MSEKEYPVKIDEAELAQRVDPLSYAVLRNAATETAFTGEYTETETIGVYKCKACLEDRSLAPRIRTEVRCAACGSHLGHVFKGEGYAVPTDERWCINSVALVLEER